MKSKRKTTRQVRIRSGNKAKKISESYRKKVEAGKEKASKELDKLLSELDKFLGKKGQVLKSKTRSNKARQNYNKLLEDIEKANKDISRKKKQTKGTAKKVKEYFGMKGKHAKAAAEIFVNYTMPIAAKGWRPSEVVLALAESGFDSDSIGKVLDYIERDIEFSTPDEMRKFREVDDIYMFVSHMANLKELSPKIPTDDIILLAAQMTRSGFDNYDEIIKEYWEEVQKASEDEEDEDEEEDDY